MLKFIARRLLALPLVFFTVTIVIVGLMQLLSPEQRAASFVSNPARLRNLPAIIRQYGLDQPMHVQYGQWVTQALRGNLGFSRASGKSVTATIAERFPATLELALFASFPIIGFGIWLGTLAAIRKNTLIDQAIRILAIIGYSLPTFVLGVWLLVIFYGGFGILPGFGNISNENSILLVTGELRRFTGLQSIDALLSGRPDVFLDVIRHLILPTITLIIVSSAQLVTAMRATMLDVLQVDFVRTARAKGLSEAVVNLKHARRNALIPVTTLAGFTITGLLSGSVLTEALFAYPGIGGWGAKAAVQLDFAGVLGFALFTAVVVVLGNLAVDVMYAVIDPRVRFD
jgi:ABC-type dipeptide/oligopeptide/nickel transport system permease component